MWQQDCSILWICKSKQGQLCYEVDENVDRIPLIDSDSYITYDVEPMILVLFLELRTSPGCCGLLPPTPYTPSPWMKLSCLER